MPNLWVVDSQYGVMAEWRVDRLEWKGTLLLESF